MLASTMTTMATFICCVTMQIYSDLLAAMSVRLPFVFLYVDLEDSFRLFA